MLKVLILVLAAASPLLAAAPNQSKVRPCRLNDYKCIGDNLAPNSKCSQKVRGSLPNKYTQYNVLYETPYFNATYIDEYVHVRNHDRCYVSEFFFNMNADVAVLTVDCRGLDFVSNRTMIQHNTAQEDTRYSYTMMAEYPLIRLTTNLKHADSMDLCSAYTFADVAVLPIFRVDPNDKPTANFLSRDLSFMPIYEREVAFWRARSLFRSFVNAYICDFGCN